MVFKKASILLLLLALGCGCKYTAPGPMEAVRPYSAQDRVGNVYLVRGFIGIFSAGMDDLGEKIKKAGVANTVYQDLQMRELLNEIKRKYAGVKDPEPLVLIGHSYGADDVVIITRGLHEANIVVDLLITFDSVAQSRITPNVRLAVNFYKPHLLDGLPALRGLPLKVVGEGQVDLRNIDLTKHKELDTLGTNHMNIDKNQKLHDEVLKLLDEVCPPRSVWMARRRGQDSPTGGVATRPANGVPKTASDSRH